MNFGNIQDYFIYRAIHLSDELLLLNTVDDILFRIDWNFLFFYWQVHLKALHEVHFL